jgi:hypothetical protein
MVQDWTVDNASTTNQVPTNQTDLRQRIAHTCTYTASNCNTTSERRGNLQLSQGSHPTQLCRYSSIQHVVPKLAGERNGDSEGVLQVSCVSDVRTEFFMHQNKHGHSCISSTCILTGFACLSTAQAPLATCQTYCSPAVQFESSRRRHRSTLG